MTDITSESFDSRAAADNLLVRLSQVFTDREAEVLVFAVAEASLGILLEAVEAGDIDPVVVELGLYSKLTPDWESLTPDERFEKVVQCREALLSER